MSIIRQANKMLGKRIVTLVLAAAIMITMVPLSSFAVYTAEPVEVKLTVPATVNTWGTSAAPPPTLMVDIAVLGRANVAAGTVIRIPVDPEGFTDPYGTAPGTGFVPFYEYLDANNAAELSTAFQSMVYDAAEKEVIITLNALSLGDSQNHKIYFSLRSEYIGEANKGMIPSGIVRTNTGSPAEVATPNLPQTVLWTSVKAQITGPGASFSYDIASGPIKTVTNDGRGPAISMVGYGARSVKQGARAGIFINAGSNSSTIMPDMAYGMIQHLYFPPGTVIYTYGGGHPSRTKGILDAEETLADGTVLPAGTVYYRGSYPLQSTTTTPIIYFYFPTDAPVGQVYYVHNVISYRMVNSDQDILRRRTYDFKILEQPAWDFRPYNSQYTYSTGYTSVVNQALKTATGITDIRSSTSDWGNAGTTRNEGLITAENVRTNICQPVTGDARLNYHNFAIQVYKEADVFPAARCIVEAYVTNALTGVTELRHTYKGFSATSLTYMNLSLLNLQPNEYVERFSVVPDGFYYDCDPELPMPNGKGTTVRSADDTSQYGQLPSKNAYLVQYRAKSWPWTAADMSDRVWPNGTLMPKDLHATVNMFTTIEYDDAEGVHKVTSQDVLPTYYTDHGVNGRAYITCADPNRLNLLPGSDVAFLIEGANSSEASTQPWQKPMILAETPAFLKYAGNDGDMLDIGAYPASVRVDILHEGDDYNLYRFTSTSAYALARGGTFSIPVTFKLDNTAPIGAHTFSAVITTSDDANASYPYIRAAGNTDYSAADRDKYDLAPAQRGLTTVAVGAFTVGNLANLSAAVALFGDYLGVYTSDLTAKITVGGEGKIKLTVFNDGNVDVGNLKLIDVLPYVGDTMLLDSGTSRGSAWTPVLLGLNVNVADKAGNPVTVNGTASLKYSTLNNPDISGATASNWTVAAPSNMADVKSFFYDFGTNRLRPGERIEVEMAFTTPVGVALALTAYNSFVYWGTYFTGSTSLGDISQIEMTKRGLAVTSSLGGMVGDFIWLDSNEDGLQTTGESGVNDIDVELYRLESGVPVLVSTRTTNDNVAGMKGYYQFGDLQNGTYRAKFIIPDSLNYVFTTPTDGAANLQIDSKAKPAAASDKEAWSDSFQVRMGDFVSNIDVGVQLPNVGSIRGKATLNGLNLAGVLVTLRQGTTIVATKLTDAAGNYTFNGAAPAGGGSAYTVLATIPTGLTCTTPGASATYTGVAVTANADTGGKNFVYTAPYELQSVSGYFWLDYSEDQAYDSDETKLSLINVFAIDKGTNDIVSATTTDNLGNYTLSLLPAGTYDLVFMYNTFTHLPIVTNIGDIANDNDGIGVTGYSANGMPAGDYVIIPNVNVTSGTSLFNYDAGVTVLDNASVIGTLFNDLDGDGKFSALADTPVTGLQIELWDDSAKLFETTSDTNGRYSFVGVGQGQYTVKIIDSGSVLDAFSLTTVSLDTNGNKFVNKAAYTFLLQKNEILTVNAGFISGTPNSRIGGRVWYDEEGSGIIPLGAVGAAGATVNLYKDDTFLQTATTAEDGYYAFPDAVNAGAYTVAFVNPNEDTFQWSLTTGSDGKDTKITGLNGRAPVTVLAGETRNTMHGGLVKKPGTVTIQYISGEDGSSIRPDNKIYNLPSGEVYALTAADLTIPGWTLTDGSSTSVTPKAGEHTDNIRILVYEKELLGKIIIKHADAYTDEKIAPDSVIDPYQWGVLPDTADILAERIDDAQLSALGYAAYRVREPMPIVSKTANTTIYIEYDRAKQLVTKRYVDEAGAQLFPDETELVKIGDPVEITPYKQYNEGSISNVYAAKLPGQVSIGSASAAVGSNHTVAVGLDDNIIVYTYARNTIAVTVNHYQIGTTTAIKTADTLSINVGDTYTPVVAAESDWAFVPSASPAYSTFISEAATTSDSGTVIDLYYSKSAKKVTIEYYNEDGLIAGKTLYDSVAYGGTYNPAANYPNFKQVPGFETAYSYEGADIGAANFNKTDAVSVSTVTADITVKVNVAKVLKTITIQYVDQDTGAAIPTPMLDETNEASESILNRWVGTAVDVLYPELVGYTKILADTTVPHIVAPITNIVTLYYKVNAAYTVQYQGNGGSGSLLDADSPYAAGAAVTVLENAGDFVRKNWVFTGWNTAADGSGTAYTDGGTDSFTMSASNVVLYAQWDENATYNVTYADGMDGSGSVPSDSTDYYSGETVIVLAKPADLTNTDKTFAGWLNSEDGMTYLGGTAFLVTADTTLSAVWTDDKYTVQYQGNGGSGSLLDTDSPYAVGAPVTVLENAGDFVRENWVFTGWNTAADGSGSAYAGGGTDTFDMPASNVVLYAQWDEDATYSISYAGGSGTGSVPAGSGGYYSGETVIVLSKPADLTNTNKTFAGWLSSEDGMTYLGGTAFTITADTTLTAVWIDDMYAVQYHGNGGSGSLLDTGSPYAVGAAVTVLENTGDFVRENWTFTGWNTAADGSGSAYAGSGTDTFDMPASNVVLYAQWEADTAYTVTYNDGIDGTGSVPIDSSDYYSGEIVIVLAKPADLTNTDKTFAGWLNSEDGVTYLGGTAFTITADTTLTAVWTDDKYTVQYQGNGGSGSLIDVGSPYAVGAAVTVLENAGDFVRENWAFTGWNTEADGSGADYAGSGTDTFDMPASNVVLYAQWDENATCNVTYADGMDGSGSVPIDGNNYYSGETVIVLSKPADLTSTDKTFAGWLNSEDGVTYLGGMTFTITDDTTLTAVWIADTYTVQYHSNGGSGSLIDAGNPYAVDAAVTVLENNSDFVRANWRFTGWNTEADGSGIAYAGGGADSFTMPASNVVLYAQWGEDTTFSVTYADGMDGSGSVPIDGNDYYGGETVIVLAKPAGLTNADKTFLGWGNSEDGATYFAGTTFTITAGTTLTAVWIADTYTVQYHSNGGSGTLIDAGSSYAAGAAVTVLENADDFVRANWHFTGWNTAADGSGTAYAGGGTDSFIMPASNVVLYAQWSPGQHTVTFKVGANGIMTPDTAIETVTHGAFVSAVPAITANNRYTFLGWSMNGGSSYYSSSDIQTMPIMEDIEFTAQYQRTTTTGNSGGGTSYATARLVVKGTDITSNGDNVIYGYTTTAVVGHMETVTAPIIEGYTLDSSSSDSQAITIKSGENVVIFKYNYTGGAIENPAPSPVDPPKMPDVSDKLQDILETVEHSRYINGYPDGTVQPNGNITRAEVAMIFFRLTKDSGKNNPVGSFFSDVDNQWYAQAVEYLAGKGIILGYEDGTFRPSKPISRAEFAAIASRFDDLMPGSSNPFNDLSASHWAYEAIVSAYMKGWVTGYPGNIFMPANMIRRADVVTIVNRMLGRGIEKSDIPAELYELFSDLSPSHWAFAAVLEAAVSHEYTRKDNGYEVWPVWNLPQGTVE